MSSIFICQIIFAISLLGMLFIFLRNLPLLVEFEPDSIPKEKGLSFRLRNKLRKNKERINEKFRQISEKNIHRLRVRILKIDNFLTSYLNKLQERKIHLEKLQFSQRKKRDGFKNRKRRR
ncbi:hypothetical protein J7J39_01180 [bacterium]|nr:hypothetical protein [bacterium]